MVQKSFPCYFLLFHFSLASKIAFSIVSKNNFAISSYCFKDFKYFYFSLTSKILLLSKFRFHFNWCNTLLPLLTNDFILEKNNSVLLIQNKAQVRFHYNLLASLGLRFNSLPSILCFMQFKHVASLVCHISWSRIDAMISSQFFIMNQSATYLPQRWYCYFLVQKVCSKCKQFI